MKAKILSRSKSYCVILPEKKRGAKTKRFFTHCSTRSNFKYFIIYLQSATKLVIFKQKKSARSGFYNFLILYKLLTILSIFDHFFICCNCKFYTSVFCSSGVCIIASNRIFFSHSHRDHSGIIYPNRI